MEGVKSGLVVMAGRTKTPCKLFPFLLPHYEFLYLLECDGSKHSPSYWPPFNIVWHVPYLQAQGILLTPSWISTSQPLRCLALVLVVQLIFFVSLMSLFSENTIHSTMIWTDSHVLWPVDSLLLVIAPVSSRTRAGRCLRLRRRRTCPHLSKPRVPQPVRDPGWPPDGVQFEVCYCEC